MLDPIPPSVQCPRLGRVKLARPWRPLASLVLLLGACWASLPASTQTVSPPSDLFVMGIDAKPDSYPFKWLTLIYSEVFRRLGLPLLMESYALKRQGLHIEAGVIDGEASRAYGYGAAQPALVRVEEPIIELVLALHTADPTLRLQRLDDLSTKDLLVEFLRGILLCENALKPWVPAKRLSEVASTEQGVKKLMTRRTDVYCDFSLSILLARHTPDLKGVTGLRTLIALGQSVPTYPYLHQKYAELAPRMAAVLKQMKTEGLIDTYRLQVEREFGWGLEQTAW